MKSESSNDLINGASNTVVITSACGHGLKKDEPTKQCKKCGRVLPISAFSKRAASPDGLQFDCRECRSAYMSEYYHKKRGDVPAKNNPVNTNRESIVVNERHLDKVYSNPALARFTPRELMTELKARGFKWEYMLEPQKKVYYNKI